MADEEAAVVEAAEVATTVEAADLKETALRNEGRRGSRSSGAAEAATTVEATEEAAAADAEMT